MYLFSIKDNEMDICPSKEKRMLNVKKLINTVHYFVFKVALKISNALWSMDENRRACIFSITILYNIKNNHYMKILPFCMLLTENNEYLHLNIFKKSSTF